VIGKNYQKTWQSMAKNEENSLSNLQYINQRCPDNPSYQVVLEHLVDCEL